MIVIFADNVVMWFYLVSAMLLAFASAYVWFVWWQVGGIRGAMTALLLSALTGMTVCLGAMHSPDPHVSQRVLLITFRAMWPGVIVPAAILADCYAADHNDHKSLTTRSYNWYKRITSRAIERPRGQRRSEIRHESV